MHKNINLLNHSDLPPEQPETSLEGCRDLAELTRDRFGQTLAFIVTSIGGVSAVHATIERPNELRQEAADVYQMSDEELARPTLHKFVASGGSGKGINLQFLNSLLPSDANFAPNAKRHDEPRKGEFGEIPLVPKGQQPYLWPCDSIEGKEENHTPSSVFEAIKIVHGAFHAKLAEITTRNRQLGVLKSMIDNYEIGRDVFPGAKKKLRRLKKIYRKNLKLTKNDLKAWQLLNEQVSQLMIEIKRLVKLDARTGRGLKRCTAPQKEIDIGAHIKPAPLPVYDNFDSYTEDDIGLLPFECAEISKKDPDKTSSRIYLAIVLLERIVMEHVIVGMGRNRAYTIAKDRVTGEVGAGKRKRRQALKSVYQKAGPLNENSLKIWLKIHKTVKDFKSRAYRAIRRQTKGAERIKRCRKPSKSQPIPRAEETSALKQAVEKNDADALKKELIRQISDGTYGKEGMQTDGAYIGFVVSKDREDLKKKKKGMGREILKKLGRGKLIFKALEKPLANGKIGVCVLVKREEPQRAEHKAKDGHVLPSKLPDRGMPKARVKPSSDPAVIQAAAKNDTMGVMGLLLEQLGYKYAGFIGANKAAVECSIGGSLDEAVASAKEGVRKIFKGKGIEDGIVINGLSAELADGKTVVCAEGRIDEK